MNIRLNIILPSTPGLPKWTLSFRFQEKYLLTNKVVQIVTVEFEFDLRSKLHLGKPTVLFCDRQPVCFSRKYIHVL